MRVGCQDQLSSQANSPTPALLWLCSVNVFLMICKGTVFQAIQRRELEIFFKEL